MPGKKRKAKADVGQEDTTLPEEETNGDDVKAPEKKKKKEKVKKPLDAKFGGKTEEEVMALFLPDHLKPNLDIIFVRSERC